MHDRWRLHVASRERVGVWHGEARRLRAVLDAISACVGEEYGAPLDWRNESMSADQWSSLDEIAAELERERLRDDEGEVMQGGGSTNVIQGYRDAAPKAMTNALASVGADDDWPFVCNTTFYTRETEQGGARLLHEHPVDWLVRLLCEAADPVRADQARITTTSLQGELLDARETTNVGALTLAPHGINTAAMPARVQAHPCPVGYPDGVVLVADLQRVANDPASLVDDLLAVDDLLRQ